MVGLFDEGPTMVNFLSVLVVSLVDPNPIIFNHVSNYSIIIEYITSKNFRMNCSHNTHIRWWWVHTHKCKCLNQQFKYKLGTSWTFILTMSFNSFGIHTYSSSSPISCTIQVRSSSRSLKSQLDHQYGCNVWLQTLHLLFIFRCSLRHVGWYVCKQDVTTMSQQWYHCPHKPQDLMTIIVGPLHGGLSRCKIGLGQNDMLPPFCISFNCSQIAFCSLYRSAYSRPITTIRSSKVMASSLASLYVVSPNATQFKVCVLNIFRSYAHMPQINKLVFCKDLSLQHTFAHVHMMPQ